MECYAAKTATFLALGKECTRNCGFCDIDFSRTPKPPEADEPERIALSAKELGLRHVVVTMVARDDLPDGGASHIAAIIAAIRHHASSTIEVLISDLGGNASSIDIVLDAHPDVFNHNIETVRSLSPRVRHTASYDRTLNVLKIARASKKVAFIKSGMMLGLGETEEEVKTTIRDLHTAGCDIITLGQYLQADRRKLRVKEFIPPAQFDLYADYGRSLGVREVYAGPFVRSSYHAGEVHRAVTEC
jgi:lipoic acid synthetase